MKNENVRLSKFVTPIRYDIRIKPDLDKFVFMGTETIALALLKPAKTLTLHSKEIEIQSAFVLVGKEKIGAKDISFDVKKETVTFSFFKPISPSKIKLTISFTGTLNDKMRGFYRSKYHMNGKEFQMATTQFEATDARRAFPCFDEPAHKAVFHVSLVVPKGKTAISNTLPISSIEHEGTHDIITFAPTPKMSTYLLAFIVGDFEYVEKKTKNGVLVRVYTVPGKKHQADFALHTTVKVLEFYEKYFDIPYPLNTLDMIAIPDFTSLAMENWGAITFREVGLLVDEKHTSLASKELIAEVIAHELAHQWFGNLVTMEWWTHLWLNEGFASYIPYLALTDLFPSWNVWERFSTETMGIALRLDSLASTHPIEIAVHHPDEIGEIFDAISYTKGASVIRMLADYLGEKDFRDGLRYYLKKHSYKNTETIHLWEAFQKVSKKPVQKLMHDWTSQPGHPVVHTSQKDNTLSLFQERFFASPISRSKNKKRTIWHTPISVRADKHRETVFLTKTKQTIPLPHKAWVKVNFNDSGFYRTAYSKEMLAKLVEPVQKKILSSTDRLGLVRDLFDLSEAGVIPTTDVLEFLAAYQHEQSYIVLVEIAVGLGRLKQLAAKEKFADTLNTLVIKIFSPVLLALGWDKKKTDDHVDALTRALAISRLGRAGHKPTITEAKKRFNTQTKGGHTDPDLRSPIYGIIASVGGMSEFKTLVKMYKNSSMHEEQARIGSALGDFMDPEILRMACDFAFSNNVRPQDAPSILSSVGANPLGRDIWWSFVQKNWKSLVSTYGDSGHTLSRMIKPISGSAQERHLKGVIKFFATHEAPGAKRAVEQLKEKLESNILWLKRDKKIIEKFLKTV